MYKIEETGIDNSIKIVPRKSFSNKNAITCSQERLEKVFGIPIQYSKTMTLVNRKYSKIPFLNLASIKQNSRLKFLSVDTKSPSRVKTDRESVKCPEYNVSYFLMDGPLRHRKSYSLHKELNDNCRRTCRFPPINKCGSTTPIESYKSTEVNVNQIDMKRKKSRSTIHCKVLLKKNGNFPFLCGNQPEPKAFLPPRYKNPEETFFNNLDISRISYQDEPLSPLFISKRSFQYIAIF